QHRGLGVPLLAQARFEVRLQLVPARLLEDVTLLQRQLSLEASLQLLRKASQATHLDALDDGGLALMHPDRQPDGLGERATTLHRIALRVADLVLDHLGLVEAAGLVIAGDAPEVAAPGVSVEAGLLAEREPREEAFEPGRLRGEDPLLHLAFLHRI